MSEPVLPGAPGGRERPRVEPTSAGESLTTPPERWRPPRRVAWRAVLVVTFGAVVAFLALRSSPYVQHLPWMPRWLGEWADTNGIVRNVLAFFALGFAWFVFIGRRWPHVLGLGGFGLGLEVAQKWIPGRIFDWRDIVASLAGVALAWLAAVVLGHRPR